MANWPAKDPNDILDYQIDWSRRLDDGDRIVSALFTLVVPAGVAIVSQGFGDRTARVWLTGGNDGQTASILCRINTAEGRQMDQTMSLAVVSR